MKAITKRPEPNSLVNYRLQAGASYDGLPQDVKSEVRHGLLEEQGHICAYCMQRISAGDVKIEHWHSQARHPHEQLYYKNMLACCRGNEGQPPRDQHCGTRQADDDILYNPAETNHHNRLKIRYHGDGTIHSDDVVFNDQINQILNLNYSRLVRNRKNVVDAIRLRMNSTPGTRTVRHIQNLLATWRNPNSSGKLPEYCDVAVYCLEKKLQKDTRNHRSK